MLKFLEQYYVYKKDKCPARLDFGVDKRMNRFERRRLKRNIYKHANAIMYVGIFFMASVITIAAAIGRSDNVTFVDTSQIVSTAKESVAINDKDDSKVAASETYTEPGTEEETVSETVQQTTEATSAIATGENSTESTTVTKIRITADKLNVRAEASQESEAIATVFVNQELEVISQEGQWIEVNLGGEVTGFVASEFTEMVE